MTRSKIDKMNSRTAQQVLKDLFKECFYIRYSEKELIWLFDGKYYKTQRKDTMSEEHMKQLVATCSIIGSYFLLWFGVQFFDRIIIAYIGDYNYFHKIMNALSVILFFTAIPLGRYLFLRIIYNEGIQEDSFSIKDISIDTAEYEKKESRIIIMIVTIGTIFFMGMQFFSFISPSISICGVVVIAIFGFTLGTQSWLSRYRFMDRVIKLHKQTEQKLAYDNRKNETKRK